LLVATKLSTAKLHSCYAKESESGVRVGILEGRSRCRKFWKGQSRTFYLRIGNPGSWSVKRPPYPTFLCSEKNTYSLNLAPEANLKIIELPKNLKFKYLLKIAFN